MTLPDPETKPTLSVTEAATLLDVGRATAYQAIKDGTWPTAVIRIGANVIRIPTADLLRVLKVGEDVVPEDWSVTMGGTLVRREEPADV
jgi:excisionase family DNA binding protein